MEKPHATDQPPPPWWHWLTVLSLDAPLVAIFWQALFARILAVRLPWHQSVLLGLAVWLVYAADRWIEGWRLSPATVQTRRHSFYIRWRWPVFGVGVAAIIACTILAFSCLDEREWKLGGLLVIPTLIYLLSHQLLHRHNPWRVPKELCIALIFALGTALGPVFLALPSSADIWQVFRDMASPRLEALWIPLGLFATLCLCNLVLIALWETEVDEKHGQTSLALQFSRSRRFIHSLPWLLALLGLAAAFGTHHLDRTAGICIAASGFFLGLLDRVEPVIGRESARTLVDLALLTPIVALLFV